MGLLSREPVMSMVIPTYMINAASSHSAASSPNYTIATLELSNLDMLYADFYSSVVLFYDVQAALQNGDQMPLAAVNDDPVTRLRHALEELLVHFPCAAGLVVHNEANARTELLYPKYVGCNVDAGHPTPNPLNLDHVISPASFMSLMDAQISSSSFGVPFHVAHADVALTDLGDVSIPHPSLDVLFPDKPVQLIGDGGRALHHVLAFQVTTFKCGGFSLASRCNHGYADGYTGARLHQNLCSIARGAGLASPPDISSQTRRVILGAREPPTPTMHHPFIRARNPAEKPPTMHLHYATATQFAFKLDALETLRARVSSTDDDESKDTNYKYSRNQALMALLWTAFAKVRLKVHGMPASHVMDMRFPIDLRKRGIPNLSVEYEGNALYNCTVSATLQELCESPLGRVARMLKNAMGNLDYTECVRSAVDYVELQLRNGLIPYIGGFGMPSLVGLPFYETDCGWGSPMYVGRPSQQLSDRCAILDHPAARAWNVLVVFFTSEEHACFKDSIAEYISSP